MNPRPPDWRTTVAQAALDVLLLQAQRHVSGQPLSDAAPASCLSEGHPVACADNPTRQRSKKGPNRTGIGR